MILALLSLWQQPIEISRSTDRQQLGIMLPIGVMIKDPSGGGDADTLGGQNSAYHLSRQNHTGEQAQSTVTGLVSALAALVSADALLQSNIDTEVTARINAILNILFLLESKADLVGGFIPTSQIPAVAITEYLGIAADQAEMLAFNGQSGDWCHRTDVEKAFIIIAEDLTDPASWKEWPMPVSPVTSINGQVGVVVLGKGDIGLGNVPNIDATKRENHTGTQDAGTITGLATVATSGSYNDLSDKPSIDTSRTLLYTTPTPNKPINNTAINPIENMSERLFDDNYIFPANSLAVGDYFELECRVYTVRINTTGSVNFSLRPFVNSSVVGTATLNTGASTVGTFTSAVVSFVDVKFKFVVVAVGVSGLLACNGYSLGDSTSVIRMNAPSCASCDTTQPVALNIGFYRTGALIAGEGVYVKSARLIRVNNP